MNVLVIEDEALVARNLIRMVREIEPDAEVNGPLAGVEESRQWLATHPVPDLILADIQLADGVSLDLFGLNEPGCPVIFTTAFNEYAIRAFKVNSIDYLLKPIDKTELENAFRKYHLLASKYSNESYRSEIRDFFRDTGHTKKYKDHFAVHSGRLTLFIPKESISCFVREEIIFLLTTDGHKYITDYRSLDEISELVDPNEFFRANRQHLVRREAVQGYETDASSRLLIKMLHGNDRVIVSKEKAGEMREWMRKGVGKR